MSNKSIDGVVNMILKGEVTQRGTSVDKRMQGNNKENRLKHVGKHATRRQKKIYNTIS